MAKRTYVISRRSGEKAPFLRGILVQSLVSTGLSFKEAYDTAREIRESLSGTESISTADLGKQVAERLANKYGTAFHEAYLSRTEHDAKTIVCSKRGDSPFSSGALSRSLEGCAIERKCAADVARDVQRILKESGQKNIGTTELRRIIFRSLTQRCSPEAGERYLSWRQFRDSGMPLIVLIGGTTGAGKSTVTTNLAYRLDVVQTQSTDMMREIIRSCSAPHLVPTLGYSSFEAWRGLPNVGEDTRACDENAVVMGFLSQFNIVKQTIDATITRAIRERRHTIVDGVHVLPSELDLAKTTGKAICVPVVLAVATKNRLADRLLGRSREQPDRGSSRYLQHVEDIWDLQSYILESCDRDSIPVVVNWTLEDTILEILDEVSRRVREAFPPDPDSLFQRAGISTV